jgi:hypothetical protein
MSEEGQRAYDAVCKAAAESDAQKTSVVWNIDGPVALVGADGHAWLTIISSSMHDKPEDINYLNVDSIYFAKQLIASLETFIKRKRKQKRKEKKREKARAR